MPKITVIIPVYNHEKYLRKCLDSVLEQTLSDIEIIAVDNASTDGSLKILKEYSDKINLIEFKKNQGVSAARNKGIESANGEYIAFLDSDDFFAQDFLERLYNKTIENNCDVVKGNILNYNPETEEAVLSDFYNMNDKIRGNTAYFYYGFTSAIYKTTFIKNNGILFPEDASYFEDPWFSIQVVLNNPTINFDDSATYYYLQNPNSKSNDLSLKSIQDLGKISLRVMELLNKCSIDKKTYLIIFDFIYGFVFNWYNNPTLGQNITHYALNVLLNLVAANKINKDKVLMDLKYFIFKKDEKVVTNKTEKIFKLFSAKYATSRYYDDKNLLKILVSYIKPSTLFKSEVLQPIHLGRAIAKEASKDGTISDSELEWLYNNCIGDDDFEGNISKENRKIGFLTGTYWAYKNYEKLGNPQYFGSFGYRKLLYPEYLSKLKDYDCIFPQKVSMGDSNKEFFIGAHGNKIYNKTLEVLDRLHKSDVDGFEKYMNLSEEYLLEMYVMKKSLFFDFCEWIFPIMFELLKYDDSELIPDNKNEIVQFFEAESIEDCNLENFDIYQKRIRAFIIERLTGYYIYKLTQQGVKYLEQDVFMIQKIVKSVDTQNTEILRLMRMDFRR